MSMRVFLIHGWQGAPHEGWRPWFKKQVELSGFDVYMPAMPNPNFPKQAQWVDQLNKIAGDVNEESYFIGHSLGAIAILRYLESLPDDKKVGGVMLVAGFEDDLGIPELSDFFRTDIDWEKIKSHTSKFMAIVSDDDPYNLAKYNEVFKSKLGAETILTHGMKHFSGDDGIIEAPIILENFQRLFNNK